MAKKNKKQSRKQKKPVPTKRTEIIKQNMGEILEEGNLQRALGYFALSFLIVTVMVTCVSLVAAFALADGQGYTMGGIASLIIAFGISAKLYKKPGSLRKAVNWASICGVIFAIVEFAIIASTYQS